MTIASGAGTATYTINQQLGTTRTIDLSGTGSFVVGGTTSALPATTALSVASTQSAGTLSVFPGANMNAITTGAANLTVNSTAQNAGITLINGAGTITVTALGTTASDAITLGAGTGAVTLTTASTNAVTITEGAGSQAVIINKAGTGNITLTTTSTIASTTINDSGATGSVTASGAGAISYTATAGVHSVTGGSGADTIVGFTGADSIVGGAGADKITTGGGADRIYLASTTDTGLVSGLVAGSAMWANGTTLGTTGLDIITGFVATAAIEFTNSINLFGTILRNGATLGASTVGNIIHVTGTYDSSANTFTTSLAGTSTLFVYDDNGTTTGGDYRAVVLVGYVDSAGNDTGGSATGLLGVA